MKTTSIHCLMLLGLYAIGIASLPAQEAPKPATQPPSPEARRPAETAPGRERRPDALRGNTEPERMQPQRGKPDRGEANRGRPAPERGNSERSEANRRRSAPQQGPDARRGNISPPSGPHDEHARRPEESRSDDNARREQAPRDMRRANAEHQPPSDRAQGQFRPDQRGQRFPQHLGEGPRGHCIPPNPGQAPQSFRGPRHPFYPQSRYEQHQGSLGRNFRHAPAPAEDHHVPRPPMIHRGEGPQVFPRGPEGSAKGTKEPQHSDQGMRDRKPGPGPRGEAGA